MNKNLFAIVCTLSVFTPAIALAAIVPACATDPQGACGFCDIITLINNIIRFIIYDVSAPIASILFAYAGWLYIIDAGRGTNLGKAKTIFTDVVVGFMIVLSAYLIVATIMSTLANTSITNILTTDFTCPSRSSATTPAVVGGGTVVVPGTRVQINPEGTGDIITQLGRYGISVSSTGNCNDPSNPTCTSLVGLRPKTIAGAGNLSTGCGARCGVVITGGTEAGHAGTGEGTHAGGDKIDFSAGSPIFNAFMTQTVLRGVTPQTTSVGPKYSDVEYRGFTYDIIREGNHWDVKVK